MSKFNKKDVKPVGQGVILTEDKPSGRTYEFGQGWKRDLRGELFVLAVANFVSEKTFYESGEDRDTRYRDLIREAAVKDPDWTAALLKWLRNDAYLRSASMVGAAEYVYARTRMGLKGGNRNVVGSVLQRADEPGELLGYWTSHYGRAIPMPMKRGIADAVRRLYTERSMFRYDMGTAGFRFADVLELTHPSPNTPAQGDLFKYLIDRRHDRDVIRLPESLKMVAARRALMSNVVENPALLYDTHVLRNAGMSWENVSSFAGPMIDKAQMWEALIPTMGYMALLRNLRNFDEAGISDSVAAQVVHRLSDAAEVANSRQMPFRFLSAYQATQHTLNWGKTLEIALQHSLNNVPSLSGRTLILVDRSGSMYSPVGGSLGSMSRADAAALFGSALALRAQDATLVQFGTRSEVVNLRPGTAVLTAVQGFKDMGGTYTAEAVRAHFRNHDRVVIITDEQAASSGRYGGIDAVIPAQTPVYTWNLAGYQYAHMASTQNRYTLSGLNDQMWGLIPLLETGRNARWPWEN